MKRPLKVVSVKKRGLHIDILDADDNVVLGGFGYFYEPKLRAFVAAYNAISPAKLRVQLKKTPLTEFARKQAERELDDLETKLAFDGDR